MDEDVLQVRILHCGDEQLLADAAVLFDETDISLEQARAHLKQAAEIYVAALRSGAITGFVYGYVLPRFGKRVLFIYSVAVAPAARRQGVGSAMLRALADRGKSGAWDEMFVMTNSGNAAAMALYQGAGGKRPNDDDVLFDFSL